MPTWLPEGNAVTPGGDEMRTASQWLSLLYDAFGNQPAPFPEGTRPLPSDDLQRIYQKIRYMPNLDGSGDSSSCVPPAAPTNLEALAAGALVLDVSWSDNATDETGYDVRWRNLTTAGAFVDAPSEPANATTATVDTTGGASDGDNIEVQVRAHGAGCNSDWVSDTVIVTDIN